MSRISSTAGRSVTIACSGGCRRAISNRRRTTSASVTTSACSGNVSVNVRPSHSSRPAARAAGPSTAWPRTRRWRTWRHGHRAPTATCTPGPRRAVTVRCQPGDQLQRLRAFEHCRPPDRVDHLDRPDQPDHERPGHVRLSRRDGGLGLIGNERCGRLVEHVVQVGDVLARQANGSGPTPAGTSAQRPSSTRIDHGAPGASPATTTASPPRQR